MTRQPLRSRFSGALEPAAVRFGQSVREDEALVPYDLLGSMAHARMLGNQRIIAPRDARQIVRTLRSIYREASQGRYHLDPALEDVHLNIEEELTRRIGSSGGRLHSGRSRNDQVATDLRLYVRDHTNRLLTALGAVIDCLVGQAAGPAGRFILPEATHLQDAQHVYLAQHLLVHAHRFLRDVRRLEQVLASVSSSPLGAAAVAGSSLPLDRRATARALGFEGPVPNSVDAVSDRDFAVEALHSMALLGVHASSLAEELVVWSTPAYGRARMADGYVTTSSLMPHKRNPDMAELLRAESGALIGLLMAHLTVLKGLPLSYNRDLQVAKPLLFQSFDRLETSLPVLCGLISTTEFRAKEMGGSAPPPPSVELVDQLVRQGVAFRRAHQEVARKLAALEKRGGSVLNLSSARLVQLFPRLPAGWTLPTPAQEVERRVTEGGSSWREVSRDLRGVRSAVSQLQRTQRRRERAWRKWTRDLLHH